MRVAILNTNVRGGAGTAAIRLHKGLNTFSAIDSEFLNMDLAIPESQVFKAKPKPFGAISGARELARRLSGRPPFHRINPKLALDPLCEIFSGPTNQFGRRLVLAQFNHDLLNLHWTSNFIDLPNWIQEFGGRTPMVWTLHDMNFMTGGCHYNRGCDRFINGCGTCPQLSSPAKNDRSRKNFQTRLEAMAKLENTDLRIVTPSRWLGEEAKRSELLSRFEISVIPYGLDLDVFYPVAPMAAREALGISPTAKVLLFVAEDLANHRKGMDLFYEALPEVAAAHPNLVVVSVGNLSRQHNSTLPIKSLGYVTNEHFLRIVYSAADLFVIASRQDNLPNVVLEAMACGTPTVGFRTGGIPDMVRPGQTGWLADDLNVEGLKSAVNQALNELETNGREIRNSCRDIAEKKYAAAIQAQAYSELYRSMLPS